MTLGEGKRKVLMLIDEYSSGGTLTVDEDLNVRMIDFFDLAQKNVSNYKKIIRNFTPSSDYPLTSPSDELVACRLPGNFVSPFRVWKNGKVTKKYAFTQNSVLIPQNEISEEIVEEEVNDNRGQCVPGYSGIICYPIDCCHRFVQCVNGVIYPPQVETNSFFKIVRCSRNQLYEQRNRVSE